MEFSINLLPQSTTRKERSALYLVPMSGAVTVIAATVFLTFSYFHTKASIESLSESITLQAAARDQLLQEYQQKNTGVTEYNFTDKYKVLNQFMNGLYVNTIDVHSDVVALLPDEAVVNEYRYSNSGDLLTTITFLSKGDSALFLHRLLKAEFVQQAEVEMISAEEEEVTYKSMYYIKLDTVAGEKE